jgi:RNA polymerase sigma factor (sigma-70 family)
VTRTPPAELLHDGCHMALPLRSLIFNHSMDRRELDLELEHMHPASWGWALACCGRDREIAQDVLQSAYLRIVSGAARFDGRSGFRSWVFGVIRLTAMEEWRRGRRSGAREAAVEMAERVVDPAPGADAAAEGAERGRELVEALGALSARQREVLELVFYHGMTIEEAAGVMRVSIGSARTHYDRGKKALAARLQRHAPVTGDTVP